MCNKTFNREACALNCQDNYLNPRTSSPRNVLPKSLRNDIFSILSSLDPMPGKCLYDEHIHRASNEKKHDWDHLYKQVKNHVQRHKAIQGIDISNEHDLDQESRCVIKSSWRARHYVDFMN